jgi:plastocyanin
MHKHHLGRVFAIITVTLFALQFLLSGALPASAQDRASQPRTWTIAVGIDSKDHMITGLAFLTGEIWIDAGDTIVWNVNAYEPHTVTFLPPGERMPRYNPNSNFQNLPHGSSSYDGHSFYNSGLLSAAPGSPATSYTLTFPVVGNFTYHNFVHPAITGVVHVRSAGTPYPFSQAQYNERAAIYGQALLKDGLELFEQMKAKSDSHHITVGATDGMAMVMEFFPEASTIHVGDTITFIDRTPIDDPHTVSFGNPPPGTPFPPPPYGNPEYFVGRLLNSGLLGSNTDWVNQTYGNVYNVRFEKAGTYQFFCIIHFGMAVNITVQS